MRQYFVLIHRYVGLVMAIFLVIIGLTGSVLSFYNELDSFVLNRLFHIAPRPDLQRLDPFAIRAKVLAAIPNVAINSVDLTPSLDNLVSVYVEPQPVAVGTPAELSDDELFVDAYSGEVLGARHWGEVTQGVKNFIPFLYKLHTSLAMGTLGNYALGIIALLWTIDCFIGAYLTFPARRKQHNKSLAGQPSPSWISRWWKAWKIRWAGGNYKVMFDVHRAGGLWPWAMLFVLAWSSVAMNLQEVYNPVMRTLFTMPAMQAEPALQHPALQPPKIGWQQAHQIAQRLALEQGAQHHFHVIRPQSLRYDPATLTYQYRVISSLDVADRYGNTSIDFDADTGVFRSIYLPTGQYNGDTVTNWLFALHMAGLWGLPYKVFLCLVGLVIVALSITGIYIWWKKRHARQFVRR